MSRLIATGPDVWYAGPAFDAIGASDVDFLKDRARVSPRMRSRICLHADPSAPIHEMVIVHHRSCYVRPHRHPHKAETLVVLEGRAGGLVFDDAGAVTARLALDAGAPSLWRVPALTWHGLVIESEWLVFYEVSAGPFVTGSSEFPTWAPVESDPSTSAYAAGLRDVAPAGQLPAPWS